MKCNRVQTTGGDFRVEDLFDILCHEFAQGCFFFFRLRGDDLANNGLNVCRLGSVKFVGININKTLSVETTRGSNSLAVLRHGDRLNSTWHFWQFPNQIGIVTDDSFRKSIHSVDFRDSICSTNYDFVTGGMPVNCGNSTL